MPTPTVYSCFRKSYTIDDKLNWLYFELEKLKEQGGGDYDEKIAELQRQINDLRNSVTNLVATSAYMAADIQALQDTTTNHTSQIGALDRTTRNINNEVTSINAALGSVDDDITRIETSVSNLQREITELRANVTTLDESLDTTQATVAELTDTVAQHRADLDNIAASVRINTDAISVLQSTIYVQQRNIDIELPCVTEDIENTSIPSIDFQLTPEQRELYRLEGIGKVELRDANGKRINCVPVASWTQNDQSLLRIRFMCCGSTRKIAKQIECAIICMVR